MIQLFFILFTFCLFVLFCQEKDHQGQVPLPLQQVQEKYYHDLSLFDVDRDHMAEPVLSFLHVH